MANENTLSVNGPDAQTGFVVDLTGFTFSGMSDFVLEGRYELECVDAYLDKKRDGVGHNIRVDWVIVGPECSEKGKHLIQYHPIPVGNLQDAEVKKSSFFVRAMTASVMSAAGKLGEGQPPLGPLTLNGAALIKKRAYAYVIEDIYNNNPTGKVKNYLPREEYLRTPGPSLTSTPQPSAARTSTRQASAVGSAGLDAATASLAGLQTAQQATTQAATQAAAGASADPVMAFLGT